MSSQSRMRAFAPRAGLSLALAAPLALAPAAAMADGTANGSGVGARDNNTVDIIKWTSWTSPRGTDAYDWGVGNMNRVSTITVVDDHDGDIRAEENNDPSTTDFGFAKCTSYNVLGLCDYYHTHIYSNNLSSHDAPDWKSTQTHEVGHTLGVGERNVTGHWNDPADDSAEDDYSYSNHNHVVFPPNFDQGDINKINSLS